MKARWSDQDQRAKLTKSVSNAAAKLNSDPAIAVKRAAYFNSDVHKTKASRQAKGLAERRRAGLVPRQKYVLRDTKPELAVAAALDAVGTSYYRLERPMRLRDIARGWLHLSEGITRQDFFDLYSLIASYQEPALRHGNQEHNEEVRCRLVYELHYVYRDLMDQLFRIVCNRMIEGPVADDSDTSNLSVFERWDIPIAPRYRWPSVDQPAVNRDSIKQIPYTRRADFLRELVQYRQEHGTTHWFTNTDGVWASLALKYGELVNSGSSLDAMIRAVDRIFGLAHHGGMLADYFDEKDWLEDALNLRSAGDPSQFLRYASSDVRELLRTAAYPTATPEVTRLQRLRVILDKRLGTAGHSTMGQNSIGIECRFRAFLGSYQGEILNVTTSDKPGGFLGKLITLGRQPAVESLGEFTVRSEIHEDGGELQLKVNGHTKTLEAARPTKYDKATRIVSSVMDELRRVAVEHFRPLAPGAMVM